VNSSIKRILFARSADASNFNAQAKNVQHILRRWNSTDYRAVVFSFYASDQNVAENPYVDIIDIAPDRLWRAKVYATYMRRFEAVFCPGLHHLADWAALRTRAALGRGMPTITTVEGLVGIEGDDGPDKAYSDVAGHPVYSQRVGRGHWCRLIDMYRMSKHIIAISPFLARQAKARYGDKVSMLPLGVDVSLFRRTQWEKRRRPRVICAATVRAHKRPRAFIALARQFPQADFIWYGEGELREPLSKQAARDGLANLSFAGSLAPEALVQEFTTADIMVLPSRSEGVPKVTQEAAAAGLAQVIFGHYEAPTVVHGRNGFVVWSDEELISRTGELIDDASLTERMGRAGAEMAEVWSWDIVAPQWERRIIAILDDTAKR
jgi:hypothetical protein